MSVEQSIADAPRSRPAYQMTGFGLTRHIIIRDVLGTNIEIRSINRKRKIFAESLLRKIRSSKLIKFDSKYECICKDQDIIEEGIINNKETWLSIVGNIYGFVFRIRIDWHQEYTTFTFLLDSYDENFSSGEITNLESRLKGHFSYVNSLDCVENEHESKKHIDMNKDLYKLFWNSFDEDVSLNIIDLYRYISETTNSWLSKKVKTSNLVYYSYIDDDEFESIVSDGRESSVYLCSNVSRCYYYYNSRDPVSDFVIEFRGVVLGDYDAVDQYKVPRKESSEGVFNRYLGRYRPVIQLCFPERAISYDRMDRNLIICGMLDGEAIYGSTLGTGPHEKDAGDRSTRERGHVGDSRSNVERVAVEYIVISKTKQPEQLGRLVRLIHVLGELRHAALFDRHDLRQAGYELKGLGQVWGSGVESDGAEQASEINRLRIQYLKFRYLMELCNGDISFRLGRSEYYSGLFVSRIRDLRCVPVSGFQSYDDFMRRNVEIYFNRYSSIRKRLNSTQEAMRFQQEKINAIWLKRRTETNISIAIIASIFTIFTYFGVDNKLNLGEFQYSKLDILFHEVISNVVVVLIVFFVGFLIFKAFRHFRTKCYLMREIAHDVAKRERNGWPVPAWYKYSK